MSHRTPHPILKQFAFLTEENIADLQRFIGLLEQWQRAHNLLSRSDVQDIWVRHVADSLQLVQHASTYREWVDLGSGAGFPGLAIAIAAKQYPDRHFTLVESNHKKVAFLRAAARETGTNVEVVPGRIEDHAATTSQPADIVSARALAPLPRLLRLAAPYAQSGTTFLFLKGKDFARELDEASEDWDFDVVSSPNIVDPNGRVLILRGLSPKAPKT